MRIAIAQSTYLPWLGYFDLIDQVDAFVILDHVQFEKQSWQQRNRIKTPAGLQWLTVPVIFRGRFGQSIREVEIRDCQFWRKHLRSIEVNYHRARFFDDYFQALTERLTCDERGHLLDLNIRLIEWFMGILEIRTPLFFSSRLNVLGKRTELLANICSSLGATTYVSPIGSAAYLLPEIDLLELRSIEVQFHNYQHPEYRQMFPPFRSHACILDLIFNEGSRSGALVRQGRGTPFLPQELELALESA